jgi:hypothetical protein
MIQGFTRVSFTNKTIVCPNSIVSFVMLKLVNYWSHNIPITYSFARILWSDAFHDFFFLLSGHLGGSWAINRTFAWFNNRIGALNVYTRNSERWVFLLRVPRGSDTTLSWRMILELVYTILGTISCRILFINLTTNSKLKVHTHFSEGVGVARGR